MTYRTSVHNLILETLVSLGMSRSAGVTRTFLIKDRCFIGYKYHYDGGYAIWPTGAGAVEFYDDDGQLVKMVAVDATRSGAA
jgi:hypothetical protein